MKKVKGLSQKKPHPNKNFIDREQLGDYQGEVGWGRQDWVKGG